MSHLLRNRYITGFTAVVFSILLSGCAATGAGLDPVKGLDEKQSDAIVIGKIRLIKNGDEVALGDGMFSTAPRVHMVDVRNDRSVRAKVGDNGEFAWPLQAEYYNVTGIEFLVNGQQILFPTYLTFAPSSTKDATYVGTITLDMDVDSGFYGVTAKAASMNISDECNSMCDRHLANLGLDRNDLDIGLVRPDVSLATAQNH